VYAGLPVQKSLMDAYPSTKPPLCQAAASCRLGSPRVRGVAQPPGVRWPSACRQLNAAAYALLPHVKVTDLPLEADRWTKFTDDFTPLKDAEPA
jgi:hypothetical protein